MGPDQSPVAQGFPDLCDALFDRMLRAEVRAGVSEVLHEAVLQLDVNPQQSVQPRRVGGISSLPHRGDLQSEHLPAEMEVEFEVRRLVRHFAVENAFQSVFVGHGLFPRTTSDNCALCPFTASPRHRVSNQSAL